MASGWSKSKAKLSTLSPLKHCASRPATPKQRSPSGALHDLRRTCATLLTRDCKASRLVVGKVLNHAEQGVTGQHYDLHDYLPKKRWRLIDGPLLSRPIVAGQAGQRRRPQGQRPRSAPRSDPAADAEIACQRLQTEGRLGASALSRSSGRGMTWRFLQRLRPAKGLPSRNALEGERFEGLFWTLAEIVRDGRKGKGARQRRNFSAPARWRAGCGNELWSGAVCQG